MPGDPRRTFTFMQKVQVPSTVPSAARVTGWSWGSLSTRPPLPLPLLADPCSGLGDHWLGNAGASRSSWLSYVVIHWVRSKTELPPRFGRHHSQHCGS